MRETKSERIDTPVTPTMKAQVADNAAAEGLEVADYVRWLFHKDIVHRAASALYKGAHKAPGYKIHKAIETKGEP